MARTPTSLDDPGGSVLLVQREGDRADVAIHGSLIGTDARTVRRGLASLIDSGVTRVRLDLTAVHDVDAPGVATLVVAARRLRARRGELRIVGKSGPCHRTIERLHLPL